MSSTHLDEIAAVLKRAEAAAYERGKADAKRELLEFLGQKDAQIGAAPKPQQHDTTRVPPQQQPAEGRQRAPKGIARQLAMRAMYCAKAGMTAADILSHADSDHEKMVKPASMRSELRNGKKDGLYIDNNGEWFLTDTAKIRIEAESQALEGQPSASESNNNGGKSNEAALDIEWE
ncbi:hypothetical protein GTA62_18830 [Roseobacter sp. HKCCD9010]|uniref:hypothetical protein n=1 Tax=unclassified Roseobacter TaxID=196798 RepID=UPI0014908D5E|nr:MULTISPECIES: hypothetical protein [unclassified Roseobacter]MBF9052042.1 hypothetical protein [Rhodobacterales bacterium HKCCD4356]NNV13966.1 hypothetical protein [Roseobacter sp. HKCCD7357]NNV18207.1 hypothetical protein [Roseobacter sp. HKCCD8768]NNV27667.1 hypothetical protein [Roseobacter sp. HKCCD8192]NNV31979.1 hypothetical protein [Roseobacter sp. HKCCD9061]